MGFGTVFVGYFLLLNISYFGFTDIIASLVMLMGFIRLSRFNREFLATAAIAGLFTAISLLEFVDAVSAMFYPSFTLLSGIGDALSMVRYAVIGIMSAVMLLGIVRLAKEVDHAPLMARAKALIPFVSISYTLALLADSPIMMLIPSYSAYIMFAVILVLIVVTVTVLITVYKAYMGICMPGDENPETEKSRFGFINEMRKREEERKLEFAEDELKKFEKKARKNKNEGKK